MDGVPGISQCPIAPGSTLTYKFKVFRPSLPLNSLTKVILANTIIGGSIWNGMFYES
jgi:hypothetical protein